MKSKFPITWVLISFALLSVKISNAQSTGFKLSDYKNPEYIYQTLDLNFGLSSGLTLNQDKNASNTSQQYFQLNSGAGGNFSRYKNSPQTQQELHLSLNAGVGSSSNKNNQEYYDLTSKSGSFSHGEDLTIRGLNRFFNEKQQYLEVIGSFSGRYNGFSQNLEARTADTVSRNEERGQQNLALNLTGGILVGTGRIEQVQDARLAMYILDDLQKLNREKRVASNEDVLALAREMTLLKYKRFFDYRLRKIAEITAIDAFLQKNGIASTTDATYFTSLNDNWNFANNPVRYSGKRFYTGLEANYLFEYENALNEFFVPAREKEEYTSKQTNGGYFLVAGIDCEKPKSLTWQNSASVKAGIGIKQQFESEENSVSQVIPAEITHYIWALPAIKLAADYGFGYYPNSRTWLTLKWWLLSGWNKEMHSDTKEEKTDLKNSFYTYTGPQFNAYYYLSEKLRLSLTFNGEFRFDNQKYTYTVTEDNPEKVTDTWWNQQVNAALTYSLF